MIITATRYHDFSAGHRVFGHENKCSGLHGHNYRIHFECVGENAPVDGIGRVLDFGVINSLLCAWLEQNWDHKFLLWVNDPLAASFNRVPKEFEASAAALVESQKAAASIVRVPFNPTAENMAAYLLHTIGPQRLQDTGVTLRRVIVEETRKCSATAEI